jgi:hypothetical protein
MRYAVERIRYAGTPPRYADASFRYAGGRFRYAAGGFRVKFARPRADATDMLRPCPPISNAERQRQFRERNPGYYGRLHAKRRAALRAFTAQKNAAAQAMAARREQLLLPAPVEVVEIPGMTIPAVGAFAKTPELSPVPVWSLAALSQPTLLQESLSEASLSQATSRPLAASGG